MKKIIFFTVFLVIAFTLKAQIRYDTCSNLQQYTGEWRYTSGSDTIRIYLRTNRIIENSDNWISDNLWGWHEYKRGNTIIESDYQNRFINLSTSFNTMYQAASITLSQIRTCSPLFLDLTGYIVDYNQAREPKEVAITFTNSGTVMHWKQKHREGYGVGTGATGMTLPREFALIKQ